MMNSPRTQNQHFLLIFFQNFLQLLYPSYVWATLDNPVSFTVYTSHPHKAYWDCLNFVSNVKVGASIDPDCPDMASHLI